MVAIWLHLQAGRGVVRDVYEGRIRTLFVFRDVRQAVECLGFFPTQFLRIWENMESLHRFWLLPLAHLLVDVELCGGCRNAYTMRRRQSKGRRLHNQTSEGWTTWRFP